MRQGRLSAAPIFSYETMKRFLLSLTLLLTTAGIAFAQSVTVNKIWLEHNVTQNNEKGMRIHTEVSLIGYKDTDMKATAYIEIPKGVGHKDLNNRYHTTDGNVSASTTFCPGYENTIYEDLKIFIPLSELHLKEGKHTYYCIVQIFGPNGYCASSDYVSFDGTGSANNNAHLAPAPGSFPNQQTIYVTNADGRGGILSLYCYYADGEKMIRCNLGSSSFLYRYVDDAPDRILFREGNYQPVYGQFNTLAWRDNIYGHAIVIFKDWSQVNYVRGSGDYTEYKQFTTKAKYDEYQQALQRLNAMSTMHNGGYNSGYSGSSHQHNHEGSSHRDERCKYCGGGGGCSSCNGKGYKFNPYSGENDTCPSCNGSGRCFNCHGTGKQAIY